MSMMRNLTAEFPVSSRDNVFLFAEPNATYVVFTDQDPKNGLAEVRGTVISDIWVETYPDAEGVIFADEVAFTTEGTPVEYTELTENPEEHHLDLVEVSANLTQLSYRVDVGESTIAKIRTGGGVHQERLYKNWLLPPGQTGRWAALNLSNSSLSTGQRNEYLQDSSYIRVRDWSDERYWVNDPATVTGIFFNSEGGYSYQLYLVDTAYDARDIEEPQQIATSESDLEGEIVTFEADVIGSRISSKKALLQVARCAPDSIANPILGCTPIFVDTTIHTGVAFDGTPESLEDILVFAGVSNHGQDEAVVPEAGRYRLVGRVVPTDEIDPRLPEGQGLIIYKKERVGDLSVSAEAESRARSWNDNLQEMMIEQLNASQSDWQQTGPEAIADPSTLGTPTQTPSPSESDTSAPASGPDTEDAGEIASPGQPGFGMLSAFIAGLLTILLYSRFRQVEASEHQEDSE